MNLANTEVNRDKNNTTPMAGNTIVEGFIPVMSDTFFKG